MRTLTVYVVRHADDAPMAVLPTMKKATAYLQHLADDNNGHPLCPAWKAEAHCVNDNSTGVAEMMSWLLGQCADELIDGYAAHTDLEIATGQVEILSAALVHHGADPARELEVGTPETPPPKPAEVH